MDLWKRKAGTVSLACVIAGLLVFSSILRARRKSTTPTGATISQLQRDVPELLKKDAVPGAAIAVIRGAKTTWPARFRKQGNNNRPASDGRDNL
jgi:CubicO group peptidase (beta-lactamase class C family)